MPHNSKLNLSQIMKKETNYPQASVLENADLLRVIGEYLIDFQLAFVLSFKAVREALRPLNHVSGEIWIKSKKSQLVTSVAMVEWAQSLGCEFNFTKFGDNLFTNAASNGSIDVLRWLHQKYPPNQYLAGVRFEVCCKAALNGHIEVLEYLQSLGTIVQWNEFAINNAAGGGHVHVLQWLREVLDPPCPWSEYTCYNAVIKGHLHVLQWLRAQDPPCPWSVYTCYHAAIKGNLEILKWLRSQEPPCPWVKLDCIDVARNNNHHEIVEWILSQPD